MSPMLPRQAITSGSDYLYDVADYRLKWFDNENGLINVFSKFWQSDKKTVDGIVLPKRDRMPDDSDFRDVLYRGRVDEDF